MAVDADLDVVADANVVAVVAPERSLDDDVLRVVGARRGRAGSVHGPEYVMEQPSPVVARCAEAEVVEVRQRLPAAFALLHELGGVGIERIPRKHLLPVLPRPYELGLLQRELGLQLGLLMLRRLRAAAALARMSHRAMADARLWRRGIGVDGLLDVMQRRHA